MQRVVFGARCTGALLRHLGSTCVWGSGRSRHFASTAVVDNDDGLWADFRSDTVTSPCPAMRQAMAEAVVGDDVLGDDPTVVELERRTAELLGKEAALYVTSGTQGNLLAIGAVCNRGDEVLTADKSHIRCYEAGGASALMGAVTTSLPTGYSATSHFSPTVSPVAGQIIPQQVRHVTCTHWFLPCLRPLIPRCGFG